MRSRVGYAGRFINYRNYWKQSLGEMGRKDLVAENKISNSKMRGKKGVRKRKSNISEYTRGECFSRL